MPAVGQTVTIINQSGKIVGTTKTLVNIFKEAKSAYGERKAEIKAHRRQEEETKQAERIAKSRLETLTIADNDDSRSHASSRHSSRTLDGAAQTGKNVKRKAVAKSEARPPLGRGVTDSFYVNDTTSSQGGPSARSQPHDEPRAGELIRRHTDGPDALMAHGTARRLSRRVSADDIDMDLAYGELPPPLPERKYDTEVELRQKMSGLQQLLDECNCLQHSVSATIENLQKNPDALAAVALTLAEISNLAAKLAPSALTSLKTAFPAILALLASPQFAIAAGVGVGVTIIAFGGYKIVKKIKAQRENAADARLLAYGETPDEDGTEELREINSIERWRRGIADVEAESVGTSVDGELLTPQATRTLINEGRLKESDLKSTTTRSRFRGRAKSDAGAETKKGAEKTRAPKLKRTKKEPSGLRMLWKHRTEHVIA